MRCRLYLTALDCKRNRLHCWEVRIDKYRFY